MPRAGSGAWARMSAARCNWSRASAGLPLATCASAATTSGSRESISSAEARVEREDKEEEAAVDVLVAALAAAAVEVKRLPGGLVVERIACLPPSLALQAPQQHLAAVVWLLRVLLLLLVLLVRMWLLR